MGTRRTEPNPSLPHQRLPAIRHFQPYPTARWDIVHSSRQPWSALLKSYPSLVYFSGRSNPFGKKMEAVHFSAASHCLDGCLSLYRHLQEPVSLNYFQSLHTGLCCLFQIIRRSNEVSAAPASCFSSFIPKGHLQYLSHLSRRSRKICHQTW